MLSNQPNSIRPTLVIFENNKIWFCDLRVRTYDQRVTPIGWVHLQGIILIYGLSSIIWYFKWTRNESNLFGMIWDHDYSFNFRIWIMNNLWFQNFGLKTRVIKHYSSLFRSVDGVKNYRNGWNWKYWRHKNTFMRRTSMFRRSG